MGAHSVHFVRQMTAAAAAAERTRKLRRLQRLCDHFNGSGAGEVTLSAPEPFSLVSVTNPKT